MAVCLLVWYWWRFSSFWGHFDFFISCEAVEIEWLLDAFGVLSCKLMFQYNEHKLKIEKSDQSWAK
jgi:hypothetical protein